MITTVVIVGCVAAAVTLAVIACHLADVDPPDTDPGEGYVGLLDDQPAEVLSDAEVERRFARIVGWVEQ